ncbi:Spx/MgsR family RNA polymerase-binding regulatory protein [Hyphococcus sp. DH-69]|uniref:Spx/MgsR family RNA polymerase-binding regulatory protein n=1 Tax=Hyphococcus formosus TaxID=3143534 RepID=UPI00398B37E7
MDVYGLKTCDTCRKVKKALDGANITYAFHDVREEPVSATQIGRWAAAVGTEKLLNKASTTWRNLDPAEKDGLNEKKAIKLMHDNPTLMKRPIIVNGPTQVFVGWSKDTQEAVLG